MFFGKPLSIDVHGAADFVRIPPGYFHCETASGKKSLGQNGPLGLFWSAPTPRDLTPKEIDRLPVVRLRFARSETGVVRVGGVVAVDTTRLDTFDGCF